MIQFHSGDVIIHIFTAGSKQFLKDLRHRQNGGAEVKAEALLLEPIQSTSNMIVLFV